MSGSVNKVTLLGNLTRDPELRYTPNGNAVCNLGVATNYSQKDANGERKDVPEFTDVVVWGKTAEACSKHLAKGRQIFVEGRLSTRSWDAEDGTKKYKTEVVANEVQFIGPNPAGAEKS